MTLEHQIAWARGRARAEKSALTRAGRAGKTERILEKTIDLRIAESILASLLALQQARAPDQSAGRLRTARAFLDRIARAPTVGDAQLLAEEGLARTEDQPTLSEIAA